MKKLVTILAVALVSVGVFAQSPQKMSYQAVVRNSSNALVVSTPIGMQISILQFTSSGSAVYVETHTPTTNINGVATLEIGAGVSSGNFSSINWANGPYFIKIETDLLGGTNYTITGTSQLLSVPYALYAEKSGNGDPWLIGGNTLTTVGQNFLGTIDAQPLMFKVNSTESGYIDWDFNKANTGFGFQTLISNTTGHSNTANGYNALQSNTTGINNSAFGSGALQLNTLGMGNTATGYSALNQNVGGTANTANGTQALQKNTSGVNNTAMGYSALINNTTGGDNSAIGLNALQANLGGAGNTSTGSGALLYNTTGNYNTGVGYGALFSNTTGSNNTALGNNASVDVNNLTNATALGYNARAAGSNNLILGNNDVNVGIGLSGLIPGNKLEINAAPATNASGLRFRQLTTTATPVSNPGTGVLTVDASGDVIYVTEAAGTGGSDDWKLAGNLLGVDNTYFIGTLDNFPLDFRVNSTNAGSIDPILFNTFFGYETGNAVPTGKWNTAIGNIALKNNTTGQDNTAIGDKALTSNTTGNSNTANGKESLYTNTTGDSNTANGFQALYSNTTGYYNTATGFSALHSNTTGNFNAAFGDLSLASNTTGTENAAIGGGSLYSNTTGYDNSGLGYGSLYANTTGSGNSAFGAWALKDNATGSSNSAFGHLSLAQNTAGGNSAFGYWSLSLNTTGSYNAAFGSSSLHSNLTGIYNTAVGGDALSSNTSGDNNASLGTFSLQNNTTGSNNSAFGFQAGNNVTTETNLTLIGANAGIYAASGYDNATALGANAKVAGSNNMILGNNNVNVGIGLSGIASGPQKKLEINAPNPGESGLRFRQLTSTSTQTTPNPGSGVLSVNTSGDVILVPDATGSLTPGTTPGEMLYWNGTAWVMVAIGTEGQVLTFCSGVPTWGPCTSTPNVTSATGRIWMDRNLGATQVATSSTDAASYGDLYQWGRLTDGHQIRTSPTYNTLSSTDVPGHANFIVSPSSGDWLSPQNVSLWQGVNGINNPCPAGYRIPTEVELDTERATFTTNDATGAYNSVLRLTLAGSRNTGSGALENVGQMGRYWSSTIPAGDTNSHYLDIGAGDFIGSYYRAAGFSVRCIHD